MNSEGDKGEELKSKHRNTPQMQPLFNCVGEVVDLSKTSL